MNIKSALTLLLIIFSFDPVNCCLRQFTIIKSFFTKKHSIRTIRKTIDLIENKKLSYPDYDNRTGIIWSDFLVNTQNPETIQECKETIKLTIANNKLQRHNPESVFTYPAVKNILCQDILPRIFATIKINNWAYLPDKIFAQFFIQRCKSSPAMDWHQDPGGDYDTMADFSLVLMLSQQNDATHGWQGGEFKIRPGFPMDSYESEVKTIVHEYNQAILFNNKIHSHAVSAITSHNNYGKRDLIVALLYLGKMPQPTQSRE